MALIKSTEELREVVSVNSSFSIAKIKTELDDAERDFIIPVISQELYDDLNHKHNSNSNELSVEEKKLLKLAQKALGNFAIMLYVPIGQVQISDSGIHIATNSEKKTAFEWQIKKAEKKLLNSGYAAIEPLYEYLESHPDKFTQWKGSSSYSLNKQGFINTAKEFNLYVNEINNSRRLFLSMKGSMKKVEDFVIKPVLGVPLFTEIKAEILSGNISDKNKILLDIIKPAVAHLSFARSITDNVLTVDEYGITVYSSSPTHTIDAVNPAGSGLLSNWKYSNEQDGLDYMQQLFNYLQDNEATYTLYKRVSNPQEYSNNQSGLFIL